MATDDEFTLPTNEYKEILRSISSQVESIESIRHDRGAVLEFYKSNLLPNLLQLRHRSRASKDKLEEQHDRVNKLNANLVRLQEHSSNLAFEAACLANEVESAKNKWSSPKKVDADGDVEMIHQNGNDVDFFAMDKVAGLSHEEKLKILEDEEMKRKDLQAKLVVIKEETQKTASESETTEQQLLNLKPIIQTLVQQASRETRSQ